MKTKHLPNSKGYTILELLLVMALITTLATFTIPEFLSFNRKQELSAIATDLHDALKQTQSLALGGVQSDTDFIAKYRLEFTKEVSDPANYYRGYEIKRVDGTDTVITPILDSNSYSCKTCINSTTNPIDYSVPSGAVSGFSGSSASFSVCYPSIGSYDVTVDVSGTLEVGDFDSGNCTCGFGC